MMNKSLWDTDVMQSLFCNWKNTAIILKITLLPHPTYVTQYNVETWEKLHEHNFNMVGGVWGKLSCIRAFMLSSLFLNLIHVHNAIMVCELANWYNMTS